jgi:hypothetical protein
VLLTPITVCGQKLLAELLGKMLSIQYNPRPVII